MNKAIDSGLNMSPYNDERDTPSKDKKHIAEPRTPTPFKNALNELRKRRGDM